MDHATKRPWTLALVRHDDDDDGGGGGQNHVYGHLAGFWPHPERLQVENGLVDLNLL